MVAPATSCRRCTSHLISSRWGGGGGCGQWAGRAGGVWGGWGVGVVLFGIDAGSTIHIHVWGAGESGSLRWWCGVPCKLLRVEV
jgi:hypothetical protein